MSTYRACSLGDRVVLVHDMPDQTVWSELDAEQADVLLQQLEIAVRTAVSVLRQRPGAAVPAQASAVA